MESTKQLIMAQQEETQIKGYLNIKSSPKKKTFMIKTWGKRWFELKNRKLYMYRAENQIGSPKLINLRNFKKITYDNDTFTLWDNVYPKRNLKLIFKRGDEKMLSEWIEKIKPCLLFDQNKNQIIRSSEIMEINGSLLSYKNGILTEGHRQKYIKLSNFSDIKWYRWCDPSTFFLIGSDSSIQCRTFQVDDHHLEETWKDLEKISEIVTKNKAKEDGIFASDNPLHCPFYYGVKEGNKCDRKNLHHMEKHNQHHKNKGYNTNTTSVVPAKTPLLYAYVETKAKVGRLYDYLPTFTPNIDW